MPKIDKIGKAFDSLATLCPEVWAIQDQWHLGSTRLVVKLVTTRSPALHQFLRSSFNGDFYRRMWACIKGPRIRAVCSIEQSGLVARVLSDECEIIDAEETISALLVFDDGARTNRLTAYVIMDPMNFRALLEKIISDTENKEDERRRRRRWIRRREAAKHG